MRDIILYDRSGQPVLHKDADTLKTDTPVEGEKAIFTHGVVMNDVKIPLDFSSGGDQAISVPDGYLVRDATIIKPEALKPENIKKDEVVAGVKGTLIGNMEEITVDLDMTDGDQEIVPSTEDFLISKVTIKKPETLQSKNIVKNVVIGGVKGTYEGIRLDNLEVVFPINEVTVPDNADGTVPIMSPLGLKSGQIYLIMWNNTGYVCTAQTTKPNGITMVALGNSVAWGGDDTGEPFAVCEVPEELAEQAGGIYGVIIPLDGSTTFTAGGYFIGSDGSILNGFSVNLDFSSGEDHTVVVPDGYLVREATIIKPETLVPENIKKDEVIAGVVGTLVNKEAELIAGTLTGLYQNVDVTSIKSNAFAYSPTGVEYYFPNCIKISDQAFHYAKITSAIFDSCEIVGSRAFLGCYSLKDIYFPKCKTMYISAFAGCFLIENANFPECLSVPTNAFTNCSALSIASFPKCSIVGAAAFTALSNLKEAYFPKCTSMSSNAFYSCKSLSSIYFPIVSYIGSSAFYSCSNLTNAKFYSLVSVEQYAFYNCRKLQSLYLLGSTVVSIPNVYAIAYTPFSYSTYTGSFGSIFVRASLLDTYKTASYWSSYSNRFVGLTDEEIAALEET